MKILGIETSCDETAAAIVEGNNDRIEVLSNVISSQIDIHKKYGGVVPEVAAREHVLNILPVVNEALSQAKADQKNIDAIAVTVGPGLVTSLIVGVETAKTLAYAWHVPIIPINHIEGHIYANFISIVEGVIKFPLVCLTVSGGHTMLLLMKGHGRIETIGQTLDDAAGEAFDKAAQLLKLGYPGGPAIAACAAQVQSPKSKVQSIVLPRPMMNKGGFDFSFSGLKTALLYQVKKDPDWRKKKSEYAAEFQQAVIDVLVNKTIKAAKKYNAGNIMLAGGVAANTQLRQQLEQTVLAQGLCFHLPSLDYCTDNAAMVATAGYFKAKRKQFMSWNKLKVDANLELK